MRPFHGWLWGCAIILIYFFALSYRGLFAFVSGDDLMNIQFLHGFGQRPWPMLLVHAAAVATPEYRPIGGLVYRGLYGAFGLNPFAFRAFCYFLLVVNLGIAAAFFFQVTRSIRTALLATLLFAFHPCMAELYFNSGTIYDILCFGFGVSALTLYVSVRRGGATVLGSKLMVVLLLYCLALDSKEMAITWPLLTILYEAVFHPTLRDWKSRSWAPGIAMAITIVFALVKTRVPNQMSGNPLYAPHWSASFILEQTLHYYSLLLGLSVSVWPWLMVLAAVIVVAVLLRNRSMIFGIGFALVALIPVSVIFGRAGFVWYIPLLGWALFAGAGLSLLLSRIAESSYVSLAVLAGLALGLYLWQRTPAENMGADFAEEQGELRSMLAAERGAFPQLPKGSRILIAQDHFPAISWLPLFLMRLAYHDATIWVDRVPQMGAAFDAKDLSAYQDVVYALENPVRVTPVRQSGGYAPVAIAVTPAIVNRALPLQVAVQGFHDCPMDVEYRLPEDELARSGIWKNWCSLDAHGQGSVRIDQDAERGLVEIERVRFCRGDWMPAQGSFTIVP